MKFHIVGAGAMGLLLAAKLTQHGHPVQLITRTFKQAEQINESGIKVMSGERTSVVSLPAVAWEQATFNIKQADCVLLTVKQAHMTSNFVEHLRLCTLERPIVCAFQNGLGHVERLQTIPHIKLWIAITTEGARKLAANEVVHTGSGVTEFGQVLVEKKQAIPNQSPLKLVKAFQIAGFESFVSNNIKNSIWSKLIVNSVINPLTAILKVNNGTLANHSEFHELMKGMMKEAIEVAKLEHAELSMNELWERIIHICEKTSANQSSMLQDILAYRRTEIDYINGAIIQRAEANGIQVPLQWMAYQLMKAIEVTNIHDIERTR